MNKINDFGEKIGGARKDLYAVYNLDQLNDAELEGVTRDKIWKRPNIQKLLDNGIDKVLLYWREAIRKAIPTKPVGAYSKYDRKELLKGYITMVNRIKDFAETAVRIDRDGLRAILNEVSELAGSGYMKRYKATCAAGESILSMALWNIPNYSDDKYVNACCRDRFGMTKNDKVRQDVERSYMIVRFHGFFDEEPAGLTGERAYFVKKDQEDERHSLKVKASGFSGSYFFYPKSGEKFSFESWKENTYILLHTRKGVVARNVNSEEECKALIEDSVQETIESGKRKGGKAKFPFQLLHVVQEGGAAPTIPVTGDDYLNAFAFRGGEFGNWMNEQDRQVSLDMGYVSFWNLSKILGISSEEVSLNGNLSIAFGARGHSAARAHFEPDRNVINLTKMSGAGSLAHEWGHALDKFLGTLAAGNSTLYTEQNAYKRTNKIEVMDRIISTLQYKEVEKVVNFKEKHEKNLQMCRRYLETWTDKFRDTEYEKEAAEILEELLIDPPTIGLHDNKSGSLSKLSMLHKKYRKHMIPASNQVEIIVNLTPLIYSKKDLEEKGEIGTIMVKEKTDLYRGSEEFDKQFHKENGYWASVCEMFARSFDCYVSDKLKDKGIVDTYLSGYANSFATKNDKGEIVRAYPYGEEREKLNTLFDELFSYLKDGKILKEEPLCQGKASSGSIPNAKNHDALTNACAKEPIQMSIFDFM